MKKRIFAIIAVVVILLPTLCIAVAADSAPDLTDDQKWAYYTDYVKGTYENINTDEGVTFFENHVTNARAYMGARYTAETMFCGLDLQDYQTNMYSGYEDDIFSFSKSYGNFYNVDSSTDANTFKMLFSYDTITSISLTALGSNFYNGWMHCSVAVQAGVSNGYQEIHVTLQNQSATKYTDSVYNIVLHYRYHSDDENNQVLYRLYGCKVTYNNPDGQSTNVLMINDGEGLHLNHCCVTFLNNGVPQPKGNIQAEIMGTLLGFNPKWNKNCKLAMSRFYYPNMFFAAINEVRDDFYGEGYGVGFDFGSDEGFGEGYDIGHTEGKEEGYNSGYKSGKTDGYKSGKTEGYNQALKEEDIMLDMVVGIFEAPMILMESMLDFNIFGVNMLNFAQVTLTLAVIGVVIYFIWKIYHGSV